MKWETRCCKELCPLITSGGRGEEGVRKREHGKGREREREREWEGGREREGRRENYMGGGKGLNLYMAKLVSSLVDQVMHSRDLTKKEIESCGCGCGLIKIFSHFSKRDYLQYLLQHQL